MTFEPASGEIDSPALQSILSDSDALAAGTARQPLEGPAVDGSVGDVASRSGLFGFRLAHQV